MFEMSRFCLLMTSLFFNNWALLYEVQYSSLIDLSLD